MKLLLALSAVIICANPVYADDSTDLTNHTALKDETVKPTVFFDDLPKPYSFAKVWTEYVARIIDKQGSSYYLRKESLIHQEYASENFDIAKAGSDTLYHSIYSEIFNPTSGGYPDKLSSNPDLGKKEINELKNARYSFENYVIKTGNFYPGKEKYESLLLVINETDCKTKLPRIVAFIISPDNNDIRITPVERK